MAGQIPINFVTYATVSLKAACFGDNVFDAGTTARCISNLIAVGFHRMIVDLYWSPERRSWSFCPVAVPRDLASASSPRGPAASKGAEAESEKRSISAVTSSSGSKLYQLGPYLCSENLDLSVLINILSSYFDGTTAHLNVYLQFIVFNLHAAATAAEPDEPASAVSGSDLPATSERLGRLLDKSLGDYIYGPDQLASERSDVKSSWFQVEKGYEPIKEYFTINEDSTGRQSSPDGWPCSKYVQLGKERRAFFGYGEIDPQLGEYDLSSDNVLFPPSYLTSYKNVTAATDGGIENSCFYDPNASQVSQANSSWAQSTRIPVLSSNGEESSLGNLSMTTNNLTACGISPLINDTIFGKPADSNINPYRNISLSASWAWAPGQPADSANENEVDPTERCAVIDLSAGGHWQAIGCSSKRRVACRVNNSPFTWHLSTARTSYKEASSACPDNTDFSIPRTGLENTYLYRYLLSQDQRLPDAVNNSVDPSSSDPDMYQVWMDMNSLDIASCWVSGGSDSKCPYASDPQQLEKRTVLVATIWGIVICVVAALTLFVKCNANRRNSRRGKRVIEGWEYEGVPS